MTSENEGKDAEVTQAAFYSTLSKYQQEVAKAVIDQLPLAKARLVLDLGCGTGDVTIAIAAHLSDDSQIFAIDPNTERIKLAQDKYGHHSNIKFLEGSDDHFPNLGKSCYELVFSSFALHWFPDRASALSNLFNSLKPGGSLALVYACSEVTDESRNEFHKWWKSVVPVEQLNAYRKVNKVYELVPGVVEAECHNAGFTVLSSTKKTTMTTFSSVESMANYYYGVSNGLVDLRPFVQEIERNNPPPFNDQGEVKREGVYKVLIAKK